MPNGRVTVCKPTQKMSRFAVSVGTREASKGHTLQAHCLRQAPCIMAVRLALQDPMPCLLQAAVPPSGGRRTHALQASKSTTSENFPF